MTKFLLGIVLGIVIGSYIIKHYPTNDIIKIPLKSGQDGHLDGRVVYFNRNPHNFAKLQKIGTVYEIQIHYPNGEYYNSYPYFPMKFEGVNND